MARAIDADAVKRRAWDIAEAWKDQGRDYEALLMTIPICSRTKNCRRMSKSMTA